MIAAALLNTSGTAAECGFDDADGRTLRSVAWEHLAVTVDRVSLLLSMQRALWEQVTPNLRGVAVALRSGRNQSEVEARFLYQGDVGNTERECASLAETHCIADMSADVSVAFFVVERASLDLLSGEEWVYLRHEPESS